MPARIRMTDRLQNFGYKEVKALGESVLASQGERARGHEFHHSKMEPELFPRGSAAYQTSSSSGASIRTEGYLRGSLLASYIHLHFWSQPRWAERFVRSARSYSGQRGS